MPEGFAAYLLRKRMKLSLIGKKPLTQAEMAAHLSPQLTEKLGRKIIVSPKAYNKWEKGQTRPPYIETLREILGK